LPFVFPHCDQIVMTEEMAKPQLGKPPKK